MLLEFVSNAPGAVPFVVVSETVATGYDLLQDGTSIGSATWDHTFSGPVGTQGRRAAIGEVSNRPVTFGIRIAGDTKDEMAARLSALASQVDAMRRFGGQVTFRSKAQTYRQHLEVLAGNGAVDEWSNRVEHRNRIAVIVSLDCAPYVEGDPMDVEESFEDLTHWSAAPALPSAGIVGASLGLVDFGQGALLPVGDLDERRGLIHDCNGYGTADHEVVVDFTCPNDDGEVPGNFEVGAIGRYSSQGFVHGFVRPGLVELRAYDADGVQIGNAIDADLEEGDLAAGARRWLVLRLVANRWVVALYRATPRPGELAAIASLAFRDGVMEAAVRDALGQDVRGRAGLTFRPLHTSARINSFVVRPYTLDFPNGDQDPRPLLLRDVPGDAPALCDVHLTSRADAPAAVRFGLLAWWAAGREAANHCVDGGFEASDTDLFMGEWNVPSGVDADLGTWTGFVEPPDPDPRSLFGLSALLLQGATDVERAIARRVVIRHTVGVTYRATAWVRSQDTSTPDVRLEMGVSTTDKGVGTAVAASQDWQQISVEWTSTGGATTRRRNSITVAFVADGACDLLVDGVVLYDTRLPPPTRIPGAEGMGAYPPFGVIPGVGTRGRNFGELSVTTYPDDGYAGRALPVDVGQTLTYFFPVDPALATPDDYARGELDVEVWARITHGSAQGALDIRAHARPADGTQRWSRPFGSSWQRVVAPSAGVVDRLVRVGVVRMTVDDAASVWHVVVELQLAADADNDTQRLGLRDLILVPAHGRAASPTGKTVTAAYPVLFPAVDAIRTKIIRADLSGQIVSHLTPDGDPRTPYVGPDHGLAAGVPIELPPGNVGAVAYATQPIPGNPAVIAETDAQELQSVHFSVVPRWHYLRTTEED